LPLCWDFPEKPERCSLPTATASAPPTAKKHPRHPQSCQPSPAASPRPWKRLQRWGVERWGLGGCARLGGNSLPRAIGRRPVPGRAPQEFLDKLFLLEKWRFVETWCVYRKTSVSTDFCFNMFLEEKGKLSKLSKDPGGTLSRQTIIHFSAPNYFSFCNGSKCIAKSPFERGLKSC